MWGVLSNFLGSSRLLAQGENVAFLKNPSDISSFAIACLDRNSKTKQKLNAITVA
jgi:hypothetical protein